MMWLLPIIRPLPGQGGGGPVDWVSIVVVLGVLAAMGVVLLVLGSLGAGRRAKTPKPVATGRHRPTPV